VRILFVSTSYPGRLGALARALAGEEGHEVRFLCRQAVSDEPTGRVVLEPYAETPGPGADTHAVTRDFEAQVQEADAVCEAMRDLDWVPDVVVNQSGDGNALLARHAFPECRIVTRFGAFQRPRMAELGFRHAGSPPELERLRAFTRNAIPLLELNQCDAGFVSSCHLHGLLPPEMAYKVRVLFEGCDTELYRPVPRDAAKVFGEPFPADVPLVTFVHPRLEPESGLPTFLNAARQIAQRVPAVRFAICGLETARRGGLTLRERMQRSGLPLDRFLFSAPRARSEMAELYARSDVLVYLSAPGQGSERLVEMMSCGALVLGSDTAPVREFIRHRQNGLLAGFFDPSALADEAVRAVECPAEFSSMRENARQCVVRHLSPENGARAFRHLLDGLTDRLPQQFTMDLVSPEAGEA
jgi:hypothetical protein